MLDMSNGYALISAPAWARGEGPSCGRRRTLTVPTSTGTLRLRCDRKEALVATETRANATLHQRAMHELKELVFISVYLYITLGSVILMKTAVLHTEGIAFTLGVLP